MIPETIENISGLGLNYVRQTSARFTVQDGNQTNTRDNSIQRLRQDTSKASARSGSKVPPYAQPARRSPAEPASWPLSRRPLTPQVQVLPSLICCRHRQVSPRGCRPLRRRCGCLAREFERCPTSAAQT